MGRATMESSSTSVRVPELSAEVFAACRDWLRLEEVDELQRLYAALQEVGGPNDKVTTKEALMEQRACKLRRASRQLLQVKLGDREAAAAALRENAEALDAVAAEAAREARSEALAARKELKTARAMAARRSAAARELQARFESAAWPALEAGARIALADAKVRETELAESLLRDWDAAAGEDVPVEPEKLAAQAERVGLLLEVASGVDDARKTAAVERRAERLERQLAEKLLFAAALREEDERGEGQFRTRDEAALVSAAEALATLRRRHHHHKGWLDDAWPIAVARRAVARWQRAGGASQDASRRSTEAAFRSAILAARTVLCGDGIRDGELGTALRAYLESSHGRNAAPEHRVVDARHIVRGLVRGVVDDPDLGLRDRILEVLAAADYEDADDADREPPPCAHLDATARVCVAVAALRRALDRRVRDVATRRGGTRRVVVVPRPLFAAPEDDETAVASEGEDADDSEDDDLATAARREIGAALDAVLEAARRGYVRRELDWLDAALAAASRPVSRDASLAALLRGPLQSSTFDAALDALARARARAAAVLPLVGSADDPELPRAQVLAVLQKSADDVVHVLKPSKQHSRSAGTADELLAELSQRARRFAYDVVLRPAARAAAARVADLDHASDEKRSLFARSAAAKPGSDDEPRGAPPRAFFDVVLAALDAEGRWRSREGTHAGDDLAHREGQSAALRVDLGDALRLAATKEADLLRAKLHALGSKHDYASRSEPDKLTPTRAAADLCLTLEAHARVVASILVRPTSTSRHTDPDVDRAREIAATLHARWRLALAQTVYTVFLAHVDAFKITTTGAFVFARDVDELRKALATLGCTTTDSRLLELRENLVLLKIDQPDLRRLVLDDKANFSDRDSLETTILRRADAWTRTGSRKAWVDALFDDLHLQPTAV